jgi:hypothetical protein
MSLISVLSFVGSCVESVSSLVAVACFLLDRAKDLSASPRISTTLYCLILEESNIHIYPST